MYRATAVFKLDRLARTQEQYQSQGSRCRERDHSRRYLFEGPSLDAWKAGNHFMVCYKPDRLI